MGKASSQKKVARAATTGGGRTAGVKRPMGWYSIMALVVALGVFLVAFSRNQELSKSQLASKVTPIMNKDHWHSAFSVYICDHFAPNVPLFESADGIHTHGDGVLHIHPFTAAAAGANATLGFFVKAVPGGFKLSATELKFVHVPTDTQVLDDKDWKNGDKCPNGQPGKVKFTVNGKAQTIDPSLYVLKNGELLDVGFVPDALALPSNPAEKQNLKNITDVGSTTTTKAPAGSPTSATPPTSAPANAPTSAPPDTTAPPTTGAPPTSTP
ncbi:MAG: hypothetical protein ACYDH6_10225 [Acidimicrobiales bacterium]